MKNILSWATLVAIGFGVQLSPSPAAAQRPEAVPQVAILDLAYIYANHVRFKAVNEDMRREVEAAENDLKASREELQKMVEKLDDYRRNSPEYRELEEEITNRQAKLGADVNLRKKNFAEQEARNYYTVFQEVTEAIKRYCDERGIVLVLRFNGDPIDSENPQEIVKALNNTVLHYHKEIDITPHILAMVNGSGKGRTTARPPINPGTARPDKKTGVPTKR
ncbi:MAG TPA: OmpH family outer membrane protein [Pirellulales bacterium]|nr:OmpH family outer membrane protein [Pirellulales bacterium]